MKEIMKLPFETALCPHREGVYPKAEVQAFLDGLTDGALRKAEPVDMGWKTDTREVRCIRGQQFIFDFAKAGISEREDR